VPKTEIEAVQNCFHVSEKPLKVKPAKLEISENSFVAI
jgi:hypothetical protein